MRSSRERMSLPASPSSEMTSWVISSFTLQATQCQCDFEIVFNASAISSVSSGSLNPAQRKRACPKPTFFLRSNILVLRALMVSESASRLTSARDLSSDVAKSSTSVKTSVLICSFFAPTIAPNDSIHVKIRSRCSSSETSQGSISFFRTSMSRSVK